MTSLCKDNNVWSLHLRHQPSRFDLSYKLWCFIWEISFILHLRSIIAAPHVCCGHVCDANTHLLYLGTHLGNQPRLYGTGSIYSSWLWIFSFSVRRATIAVDNQDWMKFCFHPLLPFPKLGWVWSPWRRDLRILHNVVLGAPSIWNCCTCPRNRLDRRLESERGKLRREILWKSKKEQTGLRRQGIGRHEEWVMIGFSPMHATRECHLRNSNTLSSDQLSTYWIAPSYKTRSPSQLRAPSYLFFLWIVKMCRKHEATSTCSAIWGWGHHLQFSSAISCFH